MARSSVKILRQSVTVLNLTSSTSIFHRCFATTAASFSSAHDTSKTFYHRDLHIEQTKTPQPKPDPDKLVFGHHFSDHMFECDWDQTTGWGQPRICPIHELSIHPGAKVLHYAAELFEGVKAYRGVDNRIRIFRPDMNMKRMNRTATRAALPNFDNAEFLKCIAELVRLDQDWVPHSTTSSLYMRPTLIGTDPHLGIGRSLNAKLFVIVGPVGAYFPTGFRAIRLLADARYVRAWRGGAGQYKMGSNYAPTIMVAAKATEQNCQQVLWLYDDDHKLTEVGTMNIFCFWTNEHGEKELITPPLKDGIILPGVTRQTVLDLTREWGEFKVTEAYPTMAQLAKAIADDRLHEVFGAGTACIVCPIDSILYRSPDGHDNLLHIPTMQQSNSLMQRLWDAIGDIQYGRVIRNDWQYNID